MRRPASRRAGLTMAEAVVSIAFVGLFAVYVAGAMLSTGHLSRDSYVENDVVRLANDVADEAAALLAGAARVTNGASGSITFQHEWDFNGRDDDTGDGLAGFDAADVDGVFTLGARTSANEYRDNWSVRLLWVDDALDLSEVVVGRDVNGDGDALDTVDLGHLEVQYLDAGGNIVRRLPIQQGRAHVLRTRVSLPETNTTNGIDDDLDGRVDETGPATETVEVFSVLGSPATVPGINSRSVQLNLSIVHVPTLGAAGRPDLHLMRVLRVVALRGGGN